MTAEQLLSWLKTEGVEIVRDGESLKIRTSQGLLTEKQRELIVENKAGLLVLLGAQMDAQREAAVLVKPKDEDGVSTSYYKEYVYPNGEVLKLTKEEFDNVVDVFRMLLDQDTRLQKQSKKAM